MNKLTFTGPFYSLDSKDGEINNAKSMLRKFQDCVYFWLCILLVLGRVHVYGYRCSWLWAKLINLLVSDRHLLTISLSIKEKTM